jgi:hypothetical protein
MRQPFGFTLSVLLAITLGAVSSKKQETYADPGLYAWLLSHSK